MRQQPIRHYEEPTGPLRPGQVRYHVTYRGETKVGVTNQTTINRARDFLKNFEHQITEREGMHGLGYEFAAVGAAKRLNHVRASFKTWGLTHNRWSSANADLYIVAIHLLRAAHPGKYVRECEHHTDDPTHVCEAFEVIETYQRKPAKPRWPKPVAPTPPPTVTAPATAPSASASNATTSLEEPIAPAPDAGDASIPDAQPPSETPALEHDRDQVRQAALESEPEPTPTFPDREPPPVQRGARLFHSDPFELVRAVAGSRPLGMASILHVRQNKDGIECMLVTDVPSAEQSRMFSWYMQAPKGTATTGMATAAVHLTPKQVADGIMQVPRGLPFTSHDILKLIGPWRGNPPPRSNQELRSWMVRCDDALRGEPVHKEMRQRGLFLKPATDETGQTANQYGEPYWLAIPEETAK